MLINGCGQKVPLTKRARKCTGIPFRKVGNYGSPYNAVKAILQLGSGHLANFSLHKTYFRGQFGQMIFAE